MKSRLASLSEKADVERLSADIEAPRRRLDDPIVRLGELRLEPGQFAQFVQNPPSKTSEQQRKDPWQ